MPRMLRSLRNSNPCDQINKTFKNHATVNPNSLAYDDAQTHLAIRSTLTPTALRTMMRRPTLRSDPPWPQAIRPTWRSDPPWPQAIRSTWRPEPPWPQAIRSTWRSDPPWPQAIRSTSLISPRSKSLDQSLRILTTWLSDPLNWQIHFTLSLHSDRSTLI